MEAAPVRVIQYFDGSKQGIIPLFQRPYSWEPRDWQGLWDDIIAQYEEAEPATHFMGAIVTVPVRSVPVGVAKHLVIDGQQRLTTLSILLAAIRDQASNAGDSASEGIVGDFLVNRHYKAPDDLKVVPTQSDRAAYNAVVYKKALDAYGESQIVQAYQFFLETLGGKDTNDQPISPGRVLQIVQHSLQVVMINLGETDDPYLIFESLNHKGKPLTQADLVRNYVLMRFQHSTSAGGEQETAYEELWRPMESRLKEALTEYLRHYGMRLGRNVRKDDIYSGTKAEFERLKTVEEVRESLAEMKRSAMAYDRFLNPDRAESPRLAKRLRNITALESKVFYPLLLRFHRAWTRDEIDESALLSALDALESFAVRRLCCAVPTNALNKITLELCANIPDNSPHLWLWERLTQGTGSRRWPTDDEFREELVSARLYPRRKIVRYLLDELEESFAHKEPVDTTTATIEHIMPQTLTDEWREMLGDRHAQLHDKWLDTLGNLTLTGYNPELGNLSFAQKQSKLANTHFELSRELLSLERWDAGAIAERGARLASKAVARWPRKWKG
jgi:uncharacterized protein with ParB-like and HNH nuclease domain